MERYNQLFQRLSAKQEGAFVPFVTLGDPSPALSLKIIDALVAGGAENTPFSLACLNDQFYSFLSIGL